MKDLPVRFWIESALASVTGALMVATIISRDWIEQLFGADPDAGSGTAEWAIVAALLCVTISIGFLARREWQRAHRAMA
jgi:hypothetical protein